MHVVFSSDRIWPSKLRNKLLTTIHYNTICIPSIETKDVFKFIFWFTIGFSLSKWMKDKTDGRVLPKWATELLNSELKLSSYLNDPMCQQADFYPDAGNWNAKGIMFYLKKNVNDL